MAATRTSVQPITLFGCEVKGMFQVVTGRTPVALVKTDGRRLDVLSVQDRHGGKAGEFGMTATDVVRDIRQLVGDDQFTQARRETARAAAKLPHKPCGACRTFEFNRRPQSKGPQCTWYWTGGEQVGRWHRADAHTRPGLIRLGYYAVDGHPDREPREAPPAEWFANVHRQAYREGMVLVG